MREKKKDSAIRSRRTETNLTSETLAGLAQTARSDRYIFFGAR